MSDPDKKDRSDDVMVGSQGQVAELQRTLDRLRDENQRVVSENAGLRESLTRAQVDSLANREFRCAALNLMEDAVEARRAEQRENVERRRVEEELRRESQRKDEFLATLAHELRNPLAPIRSSLEILRLAGADSAAAGQVHEMLERQVNHMVRLVDDLLEVSRITRGQIDLRKETVSLATVVRTAVELSKPLIDGAHHQLAISLPMEHVTFVADQTRISQVLSNLLNNAAKYTAEKGQIWLSARIENAVVVFSVRDNGLGIPKEMLPRVFDLFTQIDRTLGRAQGGLGIGLTLVRSLVEAHGGSVEARSDGAGAGSEFLVRLPLAAAEPPPAKRGTPHGDPLLEEPLGRILVVDDNRDAARSIGMLLKLLGAESVTVHSGQEALEMLPRFRPSIILLDIGMPHMDGNEVARRIRSDSEWDAVTLIALSGWGQMEDRQRSKEAGFDYHLIKPIELDTLTQLLNSLPAERPTNVDRSR